MNFIKNIKLPKIVQRHPVAFYVSIALHVIVFIGLLFSGVQRWDETEKQVKKSTPKFIPKAVMIDLSEIKKEKQRLINNQKKKMAEIKREKKRLRVLEDERYKKQRAINKLKAKAKKEQQAKKLAEKERKKEEKKAEVAKEKRKKIEKQSEAEAKKFKQEQEKRTLAKQTQLKEDQKRKITQEGVINELKESYINQIASRVRGEWRYQGAKDYWGCEVHIVQDGNGNVKAVDLKSCNVDNQSKVKSFKNAIKRAVNKASPLPAAPDKHVFDKEIIFKFRVN